MHCDRSVSCMQSCVQSCISVATCASLATPRSARRKEYSIERKSTPYLFVHRIHHRAYRFAELRYFVAKVKHGFRKLLRFRVLVRVENAHAIRLGTGGREWDCESGNDQGKTWCRIFVLTAREGGGGGRCMRDKI